MVSTRHSFLVPLLLGVALPLGLLPSCSRSSRQAELRPVSVGFHTRQEVAIEASGPADAAALPLRGGAELDLVVAATSGRVQILRGDGRGGFSLAVEDSLDVPDVPAAVVGGDFNRNGHMDFAVLREEFHRVSIYLNDGQGNFGPGPLHHERVVAPGPMGLVAADVDGDGILDLLVPSRLEDSVTIYWGVGDGTFPTRTSVPTGSGPAAAVATGDATGNGHADVLVGLAEGDEVFLFQGQGNRTFATQAVRLATGGAPVGLALADVNGNGFLDLVTSDMVGQTLTFYPGATGGFDTQGRVVLPVDGAPTSVAVADLNRDGKLDLVVSVFDRAAIAFFQGLWEGDTFTGFGPEVQFGTTGLPMRVRVGRLSAAPEEPPVVLATGTSTDRLSLFHVSEAGPGGAVHYSTGHLSPVFVVAADFDGDGFADVAVADKDAGVVTFLRGGASGRLEVAHEVTVGTFAGAMVRDDFDRDGRPDIAVAVDGGLRILSNRSSPGSFRFEVFPRPGQPALPAGSGPFSVESGSLNEGVIPDLLVADFSGDQVRVLHGAGGGTQFVSLLPSIHVPGGPLGLVLGRFTGGRHLDFAVSRYQHSTVSIYQGDGTGNFRHFADIPVDARPAYLRVADFNSSGLDDLVVSNEGGDAVTVILSRADGFETRRFPLPGNPTALLAQDLNRNGNMDLLVASFYGADLRVLLGDGRGNFTEHARIPGTLGAVAADLADVTGSGLPDLALASLLTSRVALLLNVSQAGQ